MVKRTGSETLAVEVFEQLRLEILDFQHQPGERLKPADLAARFSVSLGVMREALGMLAAQRLVRIERNRGFHVMELSVAYLADLTAVRMVNEGTALRLSVQRGTVAWEAELVAAHHRLASESIRLSGAQEGHRNPEWATAHSAFHAKLIEACGNQILIDLCIQLRDSAELYRAWSVLETGRDVAAEHKALLDAALAGEADLAGALLEAHIERTQTDLLRHQSQLAPAAQQAVSASA